MTFSRRSSWAGRAVGRIFDNWESEIARPILVALFTGLVVFAFSLLFRPVRRFLLDDIVPYPIYCVAESYSTAADPASPRTELLLVNTTDRELSRADLEKELAGAGGASPDLKLAYGRKLGRVVEAKADVPFNEGKGEVVVSAAGNDVLVKPQHFTPRAVLRVVIDVTGLDPVPLTRSVRDPIFRMQDYEHACYSR